MNKSVIRTLLSTHYTVLQVSNSLQFRCFHSADLKRRDTKRQRPVELSIKQKTETQHNLGRRSRTVEMSINRKLGNGMWEGEAEQ